MRFSSAVVHTRKKARDGWGRAREIAVRQGLIARGYLPAYWAHRTENFGDQMSPVILQWAAQRRPVWVSRRYSGKVLGVGSILSWALAGGDTVWGSGLLRDMAYRPPAGVRFLAVRGPLTRARIAADIPETYGDPALLLPQFYDHVVPKLHAVGVVPHYADRGLATARDPAVTVVDVRDPWTKVVDQIRSCDAIVSSSLHGLIVAEAYGIPASWIRISNRPPGGNFKFNDYYLATGREARVPAQWEHGIDSALKRVPPPLEFDARPLLEAAHQLVE